MRKGQKAWAVVKAGAIATDSSGNSDKALAIYRTRKEAEEMREADEDVTAVTIAAREKE